MHDDRPSITATLVAAVRALYTEMPEPYRIAPDPYAERLIPWPLALPAKLVGQIPQVAPLLHRALGAVTFGTTHHAALRTRAIDDAAREAVVDGIEQFVLLGAGLDSRAIRMPELAAARVFEVDHPSSQRYKIDRLERAVAPDLAPPSRDSGALPPQSMGAPPQSGGEVRQSGGEVRQSGGEVRRSGGQVRRVSINFERERLTDVLPAAGFRIDQQSFWIWEGVTVYLSMDALLSTLDAIAALSAPGSVLAMTYTPPAEGLIGPALPLVRSAFRGAGEPLTTMLLPGQVAGILDGKGFALRADDAAPDWAERYWPFERASKMRVVERLAIAERRA